MRISEEHVWKQQKKSWLQVLEALVEKKPIILKQVQYENAAFLVTEMPDNIPKV